MTDGAALRPVALKRFRFSMIELQLDYDSQIKVGIANNEEEALYVGLELAKSEKRGRSA